MLAGSSTQSKSAASPTVRRLLASRPTAVMNRFPFLLQPQLLSFLATTHYPGNALTVWDIDQQVVALHDPNPVSRGTAARFSPDSRRIAVGHQDGELLVYDLATGQPSRRWREQAAAYDLAFRPDGAQIAVISVEQGPICRIVESAAGRLVRSITLPTTGGGVAWSPDGTSLATTCHDRMIYLWDTATGTKTATLGGSTNIGLRAAFHPAGTLLASNGWESRLRLWDPILGRRVLTMISGSQVPEFSKDGRIVVSLEDRLTTYRVDPALERTKSPLMPMGDPWIMKCRIDPKGRPSDGGRHRPGRCSALGSRKTGTEASRSLVDRHVPALSCLRHRATCSQAVRRGCYGAEGARPSTPSAGRILHRSPQAGCPCRLATAGFQGDRQGRSRNGTQNLLLRGDRGANHASGAAR